MLPKLTEHYTEYNVARLGLISIQSKIPPRLRQGWTYQVREGDNSAGTKCSTGHVSGVPHGVAGDVFAAIVTETIAATQNGGSPRLHLNAMDIARASGLGRSSDVYERIHLALQQLRHTNFEIWNRWYAPFHEIQDETTLTLLPVLNTRKIQSLHFKDQKTVMYEVELHPTIVTSVTGALTLATNPEVLRKLHSPVARGLYRVLEAARRDPQDITRAGQHLLLPAKMLVESARLIHPSEYPSRVIEPLRHASGPFAQLLGAGYLKQVDFVGRGHELRLAIHFAQDGQLMDSRALALLRDLGVVGRNAETLAMTFNRETVECAAWLVEQRKKRKQDVTNAPGLLIKMLNDGSASQSLTLFRGRKRSPISTRPKVPALVTATPEPTLAEALTAVGLLETLKHLPTSDADRMREALKDGTLDVKVPRQLLSQPSTEVIRRVREHSAALGK